MLIINQSITESGATAYNFTARGTEYTIMTKNNNEFTIFSHRLSLPKTMSTIRLMFRNDFKTGPKVLSEFLDFIDAAPINA